MTVLRRALALSALALAAVLTAAPASAQEKLKIATTFTVIADMARTVAGDKAEVVSITKPGAEIHNYQPTPRDILAVRDADLVLWNGLGLELWFERFFTQLGTKPSAVLTKGIDPILIGEGPYQGKPNPHAWMSPTAALTYVDNIRDALSAQDPQNAGTYAANADRYKGEIMASVEPLRAALSVLPEGHRWLVTSEGAFSYMARDFGLKELYLWPINADSQGTPQQVRRVVDTVRAEKIPVVFSESTVSPDPATQVARETGARYGGVLYVDSLSVEGGPVPTYVDLLRVTTQTIAAGFSS